MTEFNINDPIFEDLRLAAGISARALDALVRAANENIVLNTLLTRAVTNGDLRIRLANPGELGPADAGAFLDNQVNGKYTVILRPENYTNNVPLLSYGIGIVAHELDHYDRVSMRLEADRLKDLSYRPELSGAERFGEIVALRMQYETMGWLTGLRALRAQLSGGNPEAPLPTTTGLPLDPTDKMLLEVEARGYAMGLRGEDLFGYTVREGAGIISKEAGYWERNTSDLGFLGLTPETIDTVRQKLAYAFIKDAFMADWGFSTEPDGTQTMVVRYLDGREKTETSGPGTSETTLKDSAGQVLERSQTVRNPDGTFTTRVFGPGDQLTQRTDGQLFDDGSSLVTTRYANGVTVTVTTDADNRTYMREVLTPTPGGNAVVERYDANGTLVRRTDIQYFYDENGVSRIENVVTADGVFRDAYDTDGQLVSSVEVSDQGLDAYRFAQAAGVLNDVNALLGAIRAGQPIPIIAGGLRIASDLDPSNGALASISGVAGGIASFYNLYNAMNNGDAFSKINATLSTISYANLTLNVEAGVAGNMVLTSSGVAINNFLNGSAGGLAAGGSVGVLPVLGLIASIKNDDPIGIAMSLGTIIQGSAFLATPVGIILIAASILKALFEDNSPPDAWGVASVTFGEGFSNVDPVVQASGENFGPDRVRDQLQNIVNAIQTIVLTSNQGVADVNQWLGLVPQRMPGLTFRASEFADEGYQVSDVDPLTGAQRIPFLRFDDNGQPFGFTPEQLTAQERAMLTLPGTTVPPLIAYLLNSALARGAIAPMWEVRTAKMQQQAGDPNAGITEEERAAKAGFAAAIDTQYAAAHAADPEARNRRIGHFMAVGMDLSGDGRIDARTIAQNHAAGHSITFDWDAQGYQKEVGWIGATDAFLVLDRDFNEVAEQARELFSNPLIADPGKGLRVLTAYDANGDGRIDAIDPVFNQLRVWQDLDQDGNNTHLIQVNGKPFVAQDETGGVRELRTLQEAGIGSVDFANNRYQMADGTYRLIATQALEAEEEGTRYTPVGAGIQIHTSNGAPQIVVTQVQSEQAVYAGLQIATADETIGTPGAELYEDGVPTSYDPNTQGGPVEIVISAAQLLQNDTWAGGDGVAAGLAITGVRAGAHTTVSLTAEGNVSLHLEANYNGHADFFYTVAVPGHESEVTPKEAHVGLEITPVNDAPTVGNAYSAERPVYGYVQQTYTYGASPDGGGVTGVVDGAPIYAPDAEHPTAIATDRPNTGTVLASDPDGPGSFRFEVVANATYGAASVDPNTGTWSYVGRRPAAYHVHDVTGDGQADWLNPTTGAIENGYGGDPNTTSNQYSRDELAESFLDYFTVRVYDNADTTNQTFRDVQVEALHYGPAPLPVVSDSGGGGKKPIAIDLDGDGFHFQDVDDSNVFFDVNGEGWKRRIAWTEPGDGLIAYDVDGSGKIERFEEISLIPYAPDEQTDMAALGAAFDTNANGQFDPGDLKWASFGVWRDANANGITDPGEFRGLYDMGISAINLTTDGQFRVIDGQTVHGIGSATLANGGSMAVADVTLRYTNEIQVTTTNPDGTTTTRVVQQTTNVQGQEFNGTADSEMLFGTKGSDSFLAGDGDDVVVDDGGNDVVDAGAGNDQVYSGIDNDVVYGGAGNDTIYTGAGNDLAFGDTDGTAGDDLILLEDGNDVAFGGAGDDFISGGLGNDVISGNGGNDKLFGEGGWDALFGQDGDDELHGLDGNDALDGGAGNDLLAGGAGDDSMEGGAGDDTYQVDAAGDTVLEAAAAGNDTVESTITYTLGDDVENLRLFGTAVISGTGNALDNLLVGNDQANTLTGLAGNDNLDGALGADTMAGGAGDDLYHVENAGDLVVEAAGEGADTVHSRITYSLTDNVENLVLVGAGAINGTGNALNNWMQGNSQANWLDGGAGADSLLGRGGNDLYFVDNLGDWVIEDANQGIDTVCSSVNYWLTPNVENVVLTGTAPLNATGNDLANWMEGNSGDNVLDGGTGGDTMLGKAGNDTYIVDSDCDTIIEHAGEGFDTIRASVSRTLEDEVENLILTGSAASAGTGNWQANWIQGNDAANVLTGRGGNDVMHGMGGNDEISGGAGDDQLYGSEGNDQLFGDAGDDYLMDRIGTNVFYGGGGVDVIQAGAAADYIEGGGSADVLDAGAGNDTVFAGGNDDWIAAGRGNDKLQADSGWDLVAFNRGDGVDTVQADGEDVLSLGGGIRYADLRLTKSGSNLVLGVGAGESITIQDWYASSCGPIDRLQVVTVGGDYDAASTDILRNRKVELFDFTHIVELFDAARAQNAANASNWSVMNSLLDAHLEGSDIQALGGDLSYQYATAGSLAGIGLDAARWTASAGGGNMQQLRPRSELESGAVRLA